MKNTLSIGFIKLILFATVFWSLSAGAAPPVSCPLLHPLLFDVEYYKKMNPDLQTVFGANENSYRSHWCTHGISEGRRASKYFAVVDYLKMYPDDLGKKFGTDYAAAMRHYLTMGRVDRVGTLLHSLVYDENFYRTRYNLGPLNSYALATRYLTALRWKSGDLQAHPYFNVKEYHGGRAILAPLNYERSIANYISYGSGAGLPGVAFIPRAAQLDFVSAQLRGPTETVLSMPDDACAFPSSANNPRLGTHFDIPDMAARMFIDSNQSVQLLSGHYHMFRTTGAFVDDLKRDCSRPVMTSVMDPVYANHQSYEWLEAVYTKDGRTLAGLAANDWHAGDWPGWEPFNCGTPTGGATRNFCWWDSLTSLISTDAGANFLHKVGGHLIGRISGDPGTPSQPLSPVNNGRNIGYFGITNIMKHPTDGNYYFLVNVIGRKVQSGPDHTTGICLFRATTDAALFDSSLWRAFSKDANGQISWNLASDGRPCTPVSYSFGNASHVSYNTFYKRFVMLGFTKHGVYIAVSKNTPSNINGLLEWEPPRLIYPALYTYAVGSAPIDADTKSCVLELRKRMFGRELSAAEIADVNNTGAYPSLIDHSYLELTKSWADRGERRNFDVTGSEPHLYLVTHRYLDPLGQKARKLVRIPLRLKYPEASTTPYASGSGQNFFFSKINASQDSSPGMQACMRSGMI